MEQHLRARFEKLVGSVSPRAISKQIGLSDQTIRNYLNGKSSPGIDELVKIKTFFEISIDWLITGEGPMRSAEDGEFVYVRQLSVPASAGHGAFIDAEEIDKYITFRRTWIRNEMRANEKNLIALKVVGDSMGAVIRDGDLILVDETRTRMNPGKIYLIKLPDDTLVVKRHEVEGGTKLAVSEESAVYSAIKLVDGAHTIIGQVIWFGRVVK